MLTNIRLATKVIIGFGGILAIAIFLGAMGHYANVTNGKALAEICDNRIPSICDLLALRKAQRDMKGAESALAHHAMDPELHREQMQIFRTCKQQRDTAWQAYDALPQTGEEKELWRKYTAAWERWWKDHEDYVALLGEYEASRTEAGYEKLLHQDLVVSMNSFRESAGILDQLIEVNRTVAENAGKAAIARSDLFRHGSIIAMLLSVPLAVFMIVYVTRSVTKPLRNTFKGLQSFSTRELTETGNKLVAIAESMYSGALQISSAAGQVSAVAQTLANGSSQQAAAIEETSAGTQALVAMTKLNADKAREAKQLAEAGQASADKGMHSMMRMSGAINEIQKASLQTSKIVKVIDEIAFQTNLLALNAAVEAARAGEAGKSFAVVADEVRSLAQRSAEAAKQTAALIEQSVRSADYGVQISKDVSDVLQTVAEGACMVNELMGQIAVANNEQVCGFEEIMHAIDDMSSVTQQTAATAEQSAASSEELNSQAEELNHVMQELRVLVGGTLSEDRHLQKGRSAGRRGPFDEKPARWSDAESRRRRSLPDRTELPAWSGAEDGRLLAGAPLAGGIPPQNTETAIADL